MRLSKGQRWTIYIFVIVAVIVGGWYITLTERPDNYTPKEAPGDSAYADPEEDDSTPAEAESDSTGTDQPAAPDVGDPTDTEHVDEEGRDADDG